MASSSIEVLGVPGSGEVKVMVMKDSVEEVEEEEMQTIINASNNGVPMVSTGVEEDQSQEQQVTSMEVRLLCFQFPSLFLFLHCYTLYTALLNSIWRASLLKFFSHLSNSLII